MGSRFLSASLSNLAEAYVRALTHNRVALEPAGQSAIGSFIRDVAPLSDRSSTPAALEQYRPLVRRIAQPSFSEQIARLEQGLGAALLEKLNRRVELTRLGEAILGKAQTLLEDTAALPQHFERAARRARSAAGGSDSNDPAVFSGAALKGVHEVPPGGRFASPGRHDGGTG
jgi:Bacterial regulatory helix-turn-helix protein, lysR family